MKLYSKSFVYEIQKFISQGSSSTVCKAVRKNKHYPIRQIVLLKIFKARSKIYPLELESLIKVRSDYCVRILHFELIDNKPSIILEWIEGFNLIQLMEYGGFSDSEAGFICSQIGQGLMDLKKQGLPHGDLSLSNVLINREGQIKLLDFGKGNYKGEDIFSTIYFTAPEVLKGKKPNFSSDLFSLGVLEKSLKEGVSKIPPAAIEGDSLLDPDPLKRKLKEFYFQKSSQNHLSQRIKNLLDSKKEVNLKTTPLFKAKQLRQSSFLFCYFIFLFFIVGGMLPKKEAGSVSVRSLKWLSIQIENKTGFTPFSSGPLAPGWHTLYWQGRKNKGAKTIQVQKGEHLLLTDKDLFHKQKKQALR